MTQVFHNKSKVIVTCNKRLAPYLHEEIQALGFDIVRHFPTGAELSCTLTDCIKLNLNLRCASQVLYKIESFKATDPQDLYNAVVDLAWEEMIDFSGYFSVTSNVDNPTITTPLFANLKVKDAIADRIKAKKGMRPNSGSEANKAVIHLYWKDNEADIFIDTSGETLAKHGYRKIPGKAPMLEALAAGVVMATKWDRSSPFINPMCGSGTLAIEAALIATSRSPGLYRMNYGFMHIIGYDEEAFFEERRILKAQVIKNTGLKIIATDISEDAVEVSRRNAKTAGVDGLITFEVCDFADTEVPEGNGTVVFNPEYGERLGVHSKLELTYKAMGDFMKTKCKGYFGYIFTGNPDLAKKIGLKASRKIEFYNGKLDCRLLEYELYEGTKEQTCQMSASENALISNTIAFVKATLKGAEAGHDWFHIERVYKTAQTINAKEKGDPLVVALAALLHDIADPKFNRGDETAGPKLARHFLFTQGVAAPVIEHIEGIIKYMSFKNSFDQHKFTSKELEIVQDADRLDAIGAIGIARAFTYGGFKNRRLYDPAIGPVDYNSKEAYKNTDAPTINHFYEKLLRLKDLMNTPAGKEMAERRHRFMESYLNQFFEEWNGIL